MENKNVSRFFTSETLLKTMPLLFVIFEIVSQVCYIKSGWMDLTYTIQRGAMAICLIVLSVTYFRHEKNVMKGMMGAVLAELFFCELPWAVDMLGMHDEYAETIGNIWSAYEIIEVLIFICFVLIFLTHFTINSDHHSNPGMIKLNQVTIMTVLVLYIIQIVISIIIKRPVVYICAKGFCFLANAALLNTVISIESKLDAYRLNREANGWVDPNPKEQDEDGE